MTGPTGEQPQVTATVSPAVPPGSRWGAIPRHLGRARTSTVVLSLLFLAIGALWLNIRPDPAPPAPASGGGTVVDQPAPLVPTTPTPTTEPVPTPTETPTTPSDLPGTTTSDVPSPTDTSAPVPTTTEPPAPLPDTTVTPTG